MIDPVNCYVLKYHNKPNHGINETGTDTLLSSLTKLLDYVTNTLDAKMDCNTLHSERIWEHENGAMALFSLINYTKKHTI